MTTKDKRPETKRQKTKRGVTLIELLIVIVLLGVLSTLVAGNLMTSLRRGRDARRKGDLNGIAKALELYYADFEEYPLSSGADGNGIIYGCGGTGNGSCSWGGEFAISGADSVVYMIKLPQDPNGTNYWYESDGSYYKIYALLENEYETDPAYKTAGYADTDCSDGDGVLCTYGIASVNETL